MKIAQLSILFLISAVLGGVYWYNATAFLCPAPILYRVGNIDPEFNLSLDEAKEIVIEAEKYWEDISNRELFIYDESSDFVIDFIFDERQEMINEEESQRDYLDKKREEGEAVTEQVESLQSQYDELASAYETRVSNYDTRLQAYNQEVNKYNDRGGAPPNIYEELEEERKSLASESEKLNQTAKELDDLIKQINKLAERGTILVNSYNKEVKEYNDQYGYVKEFTQGDYHARKINIYKFSSREELLTVLGHEYGHALGIEHVEESGSLMYYLLENTEIEPILSASDVEAFYDMCGAEETFGQMVRRIVRTYQEKLN